METEGRRRRRMRRRRPVSGRMGRGKPTTEQWQ
jgi:hypothetical protein